MDIQQLSQFHTPRYRHGTSQHLGEDMLIPSRIFDSTSPRYPFHCGCSQCCRKSCPSSTVEREAKIGRCLLRNVMLEDIGYATESSTLVQLLRNLILGLRYLIIICISCLLTQWNSWRAFWLEMCVWFWIPMCCETFELFDSADVSSGSCELFLEPLEGFYENAMRQSGLK